MASQLTHKVPRHCFALSHIMAHFVPYCKQKVQRYGTFINIAQKGAEQYGRFVQKDKNALCGA